MGEGHNFTNITYEVRDLVAHITMNTPENLNLLSPAMIREVDQAMLAADADNNVRVIIFTGAGRAFSAGHDLSGKSREAPPPGSPREGSVEARLDFEQEYYFDANLRIRNLKKPTIAGLRGHVVLGGLFTAEMCDLIIAEESTNLWNPSLRHAGSGGEIMTLPWEIGPRKAKGALWTGDSIDIHTAERLGMINKVVPDGTLNAECQRMADRIALMPPRMVQWTKRSINKGMEFQGQLAAWEYHFILHQLGHASDTDRDWHAEAAKRRNEGVMKAWLDYREGPFREQAKREYK
jgi:enoyl-CoA hydratase